MDSAELPFVIIFLQIQDGDIQDSGIQNGVLLVYYDVHAPLCPRSYIRPLYWKAT